MAIPLLPREELLDLFSADELREGAESTDTSDILPCPTNHLAFGELDGGTGQEHIRWATDRDAIDYDLLPPRQDGPFTFTAGHLRALLTLNHFQVPAGQRRLIFGLRGCRLALGQDQATLAPALTLAEDTPDHDTQRCVIGVLDVATGGLAAFRASTVPAWNYMWCNTEFVWTGGEGGDPRRSESWRARSSHAQRSNLLPTGLYRYTVGRHNTTPGALRLNQDVMALRSCTNLEYTSRDWWDGPFNPSDNIHPAWSDGYSGARPKPKFDSAGCQTIPGAYDTASKAHLRAWRQFREAAGLTDPDIGAEDGAAYTYVLLTGREARLVAAGGDLRGLARLRIGSTSPEVSKLKRALKAGGFLHERANEREDLCAWTAEALILWQRRKDKNPRRPDGRASPANAKVGPVEAAAFGLNITPSGLIG